MRKILLLALLAITLPAAAQNIIRYHYGDNPAWASPPSTTVVGRSLQLRDQPSASAFCISGRIQQQVKHTHPRSNC